MRAVADTTLAVGIFQVPVKMFKASATDSLNLKSVCECGTVPKMRIDCPNCQAQYSSWYAVPNRMYKSGDTEIVLTKEEMANLPIEKIDVLKVIRIVDFKKVGVYYALGSCYFILPPEDASVETLKAYSVIVKALDQKGWAMLTHFTMRHKTYRFAVISDSEQMTLMAYKLQFKRTLPYEIHGVEASELEANQVSSLLEVAYEDRVELEEEENPLLDLIERKLESVVGSGVSDSVLRV